MIQYDTHYRKGFHGDPDLWDRFREAILEGDCNGIHDCLDARCDYLGIEKGPAVDPDIFATRSSDLEIFSIRVDTPSVGSAEFDAEWEFVNSLVSLRDLPMTSLPDTLPLSLREVPYFLRNQKVRSSSPGVDFMGTEATFVPVQEGRAPTETAVRTEEKPIETLRDAAWFVYDDNPLTVYIGALADMIQDGVDYRLPNGLMRGSRSKRFAAVGMPYLMGALGMIMNRVGLISFREKWSQLVPRPEQYGVDRGFGFLPQVFPEGSPQHPSRNAMHKIIYEAMTAFLLEIFDNFHVLPNGKTVEYELNLLSGAGGDYRLAAGVHYASDNDPYSVRSMALGQKIARELSF